MTVGSKVKQTLATLKGAQSTLRTYSLQTQVKETKTIYREAINVTEKVIGDLENRVKTIEFEEQQYKGL